MTKIRNISCLTRWLSALLLVTSLTLQMVLPVTYAAETRVASAEEYAIFLKDKHGIHIETPITKGQLIRYVADLLELQAPEEDVAFTDLDADDELYASAAALYAEGILSGPEVDADEPLKPWVAALIAVRASNLRELALTYSQFKVDAALARLGLSSASFNAVNGRELATAVDTGLIPADYYGEFASNRVASPELVQTLLDKVLEFNGAYKRYIGYVSDDDINSKYITPFETSNLIEIPTLQPLVDDALKQDVVTGYNLKDSRFDANFVPSLTVTYGHSDVRHAIQLLALLRSEGIDARVQFEPKTSAYVHRKEWGEPYVDENSKAVLTENGNYIHSSKEYDLVLEFFHQEDKEAFQTIILQYAKKNASDQPGLIYGSWFQPLFYTLTEPKSEGYRLIANNKITDGYFYAQTFSLVDATDDIAAGFAKLDPEIEVESYTFWANEAFYNYLNGEGL